MSDRDKTLRFFNEPTSHFIPVTAYYHFGQQHLDGLMHSQLQIEFYKKFRPNILKVMNDYSFILPSFYRVGSADSFSGSRHRPALQYGEQITALENIVRKLKSEVVILDTLFNPWFTIKRHILFNDIEDYMASRGNELHHLLSYVTDALLVYIERSAMTGIDGFLYSIPAAEEYVSKEQYLEFMKPYDEKILNALDNHKLIKIVHIHGHGSLYYEDIISSHKMHSLSWSDKNTNLSLAKAKGLTSSALMGGINENKNFNYLPYNKLEQEIDEAIEVMEGHRFILSPGCVLIPQCPTERLMHYFNYSKEKVLERERVK